MARFAASGSALAVNESERYAELWMGTHPNAPCSVVTEEDGSTRPLSEVLAQDPQLMGSTLHAAYDGDLPFLFKVLSIDKALSIQAHPDKHLARHLHLTRPDLYKDPNHKPEMAVAVGDDFEALSGFRPIAEVDRFAQLVPEFRAVIGERAATMLSLVTSAASGLPFVVYLFLLLLCVLFNARVLVIRASCVCLCWSFVHFC